ncbi:endonuclease [Erysipelothrix urinaevulpis]|uniref:endonuclease/exonuclease/phosphatase family protein n=1 Tax=Erysipelothrix urinaevulpis TaxID=2683717 RepID=UPI001358A603|nr:endonuclease [Erysipelothrix urinaevulpis]
MKKHQKKILKGLALTGGILILLLIAFIGFAAINDYRPALITPLESINKSESIMVEKGREYSISTFNIGYGGLGKDQDFFMDGGSRSGADTQEEVIENIQAIDQFILNLNPDFELYQEVDTKGKRSYDVNQLDVLMKNKNNGYFAYNYKVKFVPIPITHPMGHAESGILTVSDFQALKSERVSFDGKEPWIKQLFDLKRAFTITRYDVDDKELVIINAHFSAFDKGGTVRAQQLEQMRRVLIKERNKGNYVILGGDFNHELPGTDSKNFTWTDDYPEWIMKLPDDFTPKGFNWANTKEAPTVRAVDKAYKKDETFVAVIDGFLVSDNIDIMAIKTYDNLQFENSDHHPVVLNFRLN